ncbi:conserved hypothetical protein [Candidatus Sulfopaludibacter sp. SbA6]|nr:conserved hypothetical protein [Candidatus Sulfopaludibacter sp. SbA6]
MPVPVAAFIIAFIGLIALVRKLAQQLVSSNCLPEGTAWIDELSTDRYRPMLRLLDQEDLEFLTPKMATRLRILRCQIFRVYLRNMDADFGRICMALKSILLHSKIDRPDLVSALVQRQMLFAYRKMNIQLRALLYQYGVGTVDVSDLVRLFEGMRLELRTLVQAELAARA